MNVTPKPPRRRDSVFSLIGWLHYWIVIVIVLLIAMFQVVLVPYLLEPLANRALAHFGDKFTAQLGIPVVFGYTSLNIAFGLDGMYIAVSEPHCMLGPNSISAEEAALVIRPDALPVLVVRQPRIPVAQDSSGVFSIAGVSLAQLMPLFGTAQDLSSDILDIGPLPSTLLAIDTEISFTTATGATLTLPKVTAGLRPDPTTAVLQLSFLSDFNNKFRFYGRVDLPQRTNRQDGSFYVTVLNGEELLNQLEIPTIMVGASLESWGSFRGTESVEALVLLHSQGVEQNLGLSVPANNHIPSAAVPATATVTAVRPVPPPTLTPPSDQAQAQDVNLALELTITDPLTPARLTTARWHARAQKMDVQAPEPYLGSPLLLDTLEASGTVSRTPGGWHFSADDLRWDGPVGSGSGVLDLTLAAGHEPVLDLQASAPILDVGILMELLPLSAGERTVRFLRNDLTADHSQLQTLVVSGSDWDSFPWPTGNGGNFRLQADFLGAELDYANGYPAIEQADGNLNLVGTALSITVATGNVGPATVDIARAGIDDLQAVESTLFVALDASLGEGSLVTLLDLLPATQTIAAPYLTDLLITGEQDLNLALVIPLDADDPVAVDGELALQPPNQLNYLPQQLVVSAMSGSFLFNNDGVNGIARGTALDTGIRMSVAINDQSASLAVDGTVDIANALKLLNQQTNLPLTGKSAVAIAISADEFTLTSDLVGTAIALPAPFGKEPDTARLTTVRIADELMHLDYGAGLVKVARDTATDAIAIALGPASTVAVPPTSGIQVSGILPDLDLDSMLADWGTADNGWQIEQAAIELDLPGATLLGLKHPNLDLVASITTITVATIDATAIAGQVIISDDAVTLSLAHLEFPPDSDSEPPSAATTIFVDPGTLSPSLPTLALTIDNLILGEQEYSQLTAQGVPLENQWHLTGFQAHVGENIITATGTTNVRGNPATDLTFNAQLVDLPSFIANYSDGDSLQTGAANLVGTISWMGALHDPHLLSMTGTMSLTASEFIVNQSSGGAKFINLLSPFTLLRTLPSLAVEGTEFRKADGQFTFTDGDLIIDKLTMIGSDINVNVTGSTNLITERNDIHSVVVLKASDNITTGAVSLINPIAGAIMLVFDKVLKAPLVADLRINYDITGTWEEPVIDQQQADLDDDDS